MSIKCTCGNVGCSTQMIVTTDRQSHTVELVIEHKDKDEKFATTRITLDANSLILLIRGLKSYLQELV